jgi:hypothetical protein
VILRGIFRRCSDAAIESQKIAGCVIAFKETCTESITGTRPPDFERTNQCV